MTATEARPDALEQTPQSQRLAELEAMLDNKNYAGFRTEIQQAIDELRATTVPGA